LSNVVSRIPSLLFLYNLFALAIAHIVVEDTPEAGVVVTAYIPDQNKWIANKQRRKSKRKK